MEFLVPGVKFDCILHFAEMITFRPLLFLGIMPFLKGVRKQTSDVKIDGTDEAKDFCK